MLKEVSSLPESSPATPYNAASVLLSLRLRSPKYLAFLLTLKSDRYTKPAFSYLCSSWHLSIPDPLCYYRSPPFLDGEPELSSELLRAGSGARLREQ
jgi:hypothetical protein